MSIWQSSYFPYERENVLELLLGREALRLVKKPLISLRVERPLLGGKVYISYYIIICTRMWIYCLGCKCLHASLTGIIIK